MKNRLSLLALTCVAFCAIGCDAKDKMDISLSGSNGEKISIKSEGDKGTLSATGSNGEHLDLDANNGEMKMKGSDKDGNKVDLKVGGNPTLTEQELGLPFFPDSKPNTEANTTDAKTKLSSLVSIRTTSEDPSKVADFYKQKIKDANGSISMSSTNVTNDGTNIALEGYTDKLAKKFKISIERTKSSDHTEVSVSVESPGPVELHSDSNIPR